MKKQRCVSLVSKPRKNKLKKIKLIPMRRVAKKILSDKKT